MQQYYVQYNSESEGGWQPLLLRSSSNNALERALMYEKSGEQGTGDYSETKIFSLDTDTNVFMLTRHIVIKRKAVVQYNKRGSIKAAPKVAPSTWNDAAFVAQYFQPTAVTNAD